MASSGAQRKGSIMSSSTTNYTLTLLFRKNLARLQRAKTSQQISCLWQDQEV